MEIKFLPRFFFYMFCSFIKQYKRQKTPYLLTSFSMLTKLFWHVEQILKYGLKKKTDSLINFTNYYNYGYIKSNSKNKAQIRSVHRIHPHCPQQTKFVFQNTMDG